MKKPFRSEWVKCPICGESGMNKTWEANKDDGPYIHCVNINCGSNGGDNFEALSPTPNRSEVEKALETLRRALQDSGQIDYQHSRP